MVWPIIWCVQDLGVPQGARLKFSYENIQDSQEQAGHTSHTHCPRDNPQTVEKVMKLAPGTITMGWATSAISCNWASPWVILTIVLWSRHNRCDFRMWDHPEMWLRKYGVWGVPSWCDVVTKLSKVLLVFKLLYHTDSWKALYAQLPPLQNGIFHSALAGSSIKYSQTRPSGSSDCPFM